MRTRVRVDPDELGDVLSRVRVELFEEHLQVAGVQQLVAELHCTIASAVSICASTTQNSL